MDKLIDFDTDIAVKLTGVEDKDLLIFYVNSVIKRIEQILHYKLVKGQKEDMITGLDTNYIFLKERNIERVLNAYRGCYVIDGTLIGRKLIFDHVIPKNEFIRVSYVAGYDSIPEDLLFFICSTIKENLSNEEGLKSYGIRGINYTYLDKIEQSDNFLRGVRDLFGGVEI